MCQTMRHESTEPLAEERGNAVMLGPEGPESPPGPWGDGAGRRWGEWGAAAVGFTSSDPSLGNLWPASSPSSRPTWEPDHEVPSCAGPGSQSPHRHALRALDGKSSQRWGAGPTPRAFYHSEA